MRLVSTRGRAGESDFSHAVFSGLASDGGLWVPEHLPTLESADLEALAEMDWPELSTWLARFLLADEIPATLLDPLVRDALDFEIPLVPLEDGLFVLELYHGPTLAFKDVAARFLARVMAQLSRDGERPLTVLVATSGDTGSAVAQAFYRVPGVSVKVLYPRGQVSEAQRKLFTTLGHNVEALEIEGSFDDCQAMVKAVFSNTELRERRPLASANSINIGRLLPQSFYYFWAWAQLRQQIGTHADGVRLSVPSGNFGNLTAGLIAHRIGLPCGRFVAATNSNDVVPRYLGSGSYDPVASVSTISNAMDVGDPSNFARILDLYGGDADALRRDVRGSRHDDAETRAAIRDVHARTGYVMDPHTAVGYLGIRELPRADGGPDVLLATAHPAKFRESVEPAIGAKVPVPPALAACLERESRAETIAADSAAVRRALLDGSAAS